MAQAAGSADEIPTPAASAGSSQSAEWAMAAMALAAEVALAVGHIVFGMGLFPILAGHLAVVALGGWWVLRRSNGVADVSPSVLIVLAVAVGGPIGAAAALLIPRFSRRSAKTGPLLEDWYQRIALSAEISRETELCDNVASGRTMDLAAPPPRSFAATIADGTLAEKQVALGLIARRFHPDYLPALTAALKSPEPVVRVQAAAVAARVRDELKTRTRDVLAELEAGARPERMRAACPELAKAAASGLLEETDRRRADAILAITTLPAADDAHPPWAAGGTLDPRQEDELVRERRFRDLRIARRCGRIARHGRYRIKRRRRLAARGAAP